MTRKVQNVDIPVFHFTARNNYLYGYFEFKTEEEAEKYVTKLPSLFNWEIQKKHVVNASSYEELGAARYHVQMDTGLAFNQKNGKPSMASIRRLTAFYKAQWRLRAADTISWVWFGVLFERYCSNFDILYAMQEVDED